MEHKLLIPSSHCLDCSTANTNEETFVRIERGEEYSFIYLYHHHHYHLDDAQHAMISEHCTLPMVVIIETPSVPNGHN